MVLFALFIVFSLSQLNSTQMSRVVPPLAGFIAVVWALSTYVNWRNRQDADLRRRMREERQRHLLERREDEKRLRHEQMEKQRQERLKARGEWLTAYDQYRKSREWRVVRRQVLHAANYKCVLCGDRATQVHHEKYPEDYGRPTFTENVQYLKPVCHSCHSKQHGISIPADSIHTDEDDDQFPLI